MGLGPDLIAAITNGSTAFILFTVMVVAMFVALLIAISR
jgi:hypothetical protein